MRLRELKISASGFEYLDRFSIHIKQNTTYSNIIWVLYDGLDQVGEYTTPLTVFKAIDQILEVDTVNFSGAPDVILDAEKRRD